jgi:hypothetical protein
MEKNEQTITFDGVEYKFSDLPDTGKIIVNQLNVLEKEILSTRMLLDRHAAAKQTFVTQFGEIVTAINEKEN